MLNKETPCEHLAAPGYFRDISGILMFYTRMLFTFKNLDPAERSNVRIEIFTNVRTFKNLDPAERSNV